MLESRKPAFLRLLYHSGSVWDLASFLKGECNVCGLEDRNEHTEVEATLELLLLCPLASTIREAFGFSGAALEEVQVQLTLHMIWKWLYIKIKSRREHM